MGRILVEGLKRSVKENVALISAVKVMGNYPVKLVVPSKEEFVKASSAEKERSGSVAKCEAEVQNSKKERERLTETWREESFS